MSGEIVVPKLNSNDTEYTLVRWLAEDGGPVQPGDAVAVVETSKATEELESTSSGFLRQVVAAGKPCAPGEVIGQVGSSVVAPVVVGEPEVTGGQIVTEPARELIDRLGITPEQLESLGRKVIRLSDVERLAGTVRELSPVQRAVGRTVSESHRTVPAAYTVIKVDVGAVLAEARALTRSLRKLVGLPDFLVAAVAGLHTEFPLPFATLAGSSVRLSAAPHVGVTVDLGQGLYVPVIRDAAGLDVPGIAGRLTEYRKAAQRGEFRAEDLTGANITVTLHHDPGIVLAIPIIHPDQVCALALGAPSPELALEDGEVVSRTFATIGLAYDHRVLNGRDAVLFLQALKEALEDS